MTDLETSVGTALMLTDLAQKTVRDGHIFGFTVVDEEHLAGMDAKPDQFFAAIGERATALNLMLKIERDTLRRRYELSWRPCRGDEKPVLSIVT